MTQKIQNSGPISKNDEGRFEDIFGRREDWTSVLDMRDGKVIALRGTSEKGFVEYLSRLTPEIFQELEALRAGRNLLVDLQKETVWAGNDILHRVKPETSHALLADLQALNRLPKKKLTPKELKSNHVAVVLGAGRGTRMSDGNTQKVCTKIGTRPAVTRALDIYQRTGFETQMMVVGHQSDYVVEEVSRKYQQTTFVFQSNLLGTGHAARQAMYVLEGQEFSGSVLVAAGDKVIDPDALRQLREQFEENDADLVAVCAPKQRWPNSGLVLLDETGQIESVIEAVDVAKMELIELMIQEMETAESIATGKIRRWIAERVKNTKKLSKMFPKEFFDELDRSEIIHREKLLSCIDPSQAAHRIFQPDGSTTIVTPGEIRDRATMVNISVYLFKAPAFYYAVKRLTNENAQKEYYLTDVFEVLCQGGSDARRFKVLPMLVEDTDQVLGFNTQEELDYICSYLRDKTRDLLRKRGVILDESAENSSRFWVDDIDSIEKIGAGTRLSGDTVIDLGPEPEHYIGKNCVIDNCEILHRVVPDGQKVSRDTECDSSRKDKS